MKSELFHEYASYLKLYGKGPHMNFEQWQKQREESREILKKIQEELRETNK